MLLNRYLFLNYFVPTSYVVHNEKALHGGYQDSTNVIPFNRKGTWRRIYFIHIVLLLRIIEQDQNKGQD